MPVWSLCRSSMHVRKRLSTSNSKAQICLAMTLQTGTALGGPCPSRGHICSKSCPNVVRAVVCKLLPSCLSLLLSCRLMSIVLWPHDVPLKHFDSVKDINAWNIERFCQTSGVSILAIVPCTRLVHTLGQRLHGLRCQGRWAKNKANQE